VNVAYICTDPGVPVFGAKGASVHAQEVIRGLVRRGFRVTLLARRLGGEVPPGLEAVRVLPLSPVTGADGGDRELALLAADAEVACALESLAPLDLIYERHSLWSCSAMEFARDRGIPSFLEVNAPLRKSRLKY
jgi:hypothetical protein